MPLSFHFTNLENIIEYKTSIHNSGLNSYCVNTVGGYHCGCAKGYEFVYNERVRLIKGRMFVVGVFQICMYI